MKKALILGAGMVAKPIADYLLTNSNIFVIMASRTVEKAEKILQGRPNTSAFKLLVDDDKHLEENIKEADIVISLLPYRYHVKTANYCLKYKIPLVTTSYVSNEMKELDMLARDKEVLLLNEIGLDPGIDHMSAMRIIHDVERRKGKVKVFRSYCGGLPAPEANTNPWGYKFSWSPRGVLMAGRNDAKYLKKGEVIEINGEKLFNYNWPLKVETLGLETYPNRNSLPYIDLYGIHDAVSMYRGTLRYPGWSRSMGAIARLDILSEREISNTAGLSSGAVMQKILNISEDVDPRDHICNTLNISKDDEIISKLEWLGLFDNQAYSKAVTTPIDFLSEHMLARMQYEKGERDMIVLYHDFEVEFKGHREQITSTLLDYGIPGEDSAMSRTVSLPAAIAVKLILEGKIRETGVRIPVDPEIYIPVLNELEHLGIVCKEKSSILDSEDM